MPRSRRRFPMIRLTRCVRNRWASSCPMPSTAKMPDARFASGIPSQRQACQSVNDAGGHDGRIGGIRRKFRNARQPFLQEYFHFLRRERRADAAMDAVTERRMLEAVLAFEPHFGRGFKAARIESMDAGGHQDLLAGLE